MDLKQYYKKSLEYQNKYLKDNETFSDHLIKLEKSLMEDEGNSELISHFEKSAIFWGKGADLDYKKLTTIDQFRQLAIVGYDEGEYHLGAIYLLGDITEKDYKKALFWFSRAAEQAHPIAHFYIGVMYFYGYGVSKDYQKALGSFTKSIELGLDAEPGYSGWDNIDVRSFIGEIYYWGENGVSQDLEQAFFWVSKAVELEDVKAQGLLAEMYYFGKGIPQDYKKAFSLFSKAAEKGNVIAQANLGWMYQEGEGVLQDFKKAMYWGNMAADKGSTSALQNVASMYLSGQGVVKDDKMYFSCHLKAAKAGDVESQVQVMGCYNGGLGVAVSKKDAAYWGNEARKNGSELAEAYWKDFELWKYFEKH